MAATNRVRCGSYINCYACGGRIREYADGIVLTRLDGSELVPEQALEQHRKKAE